MSDLNDSTQEQEAVQTPAKKTTKKAASKKSKRVSAQEKLSIFNMLAEGKTAYAIAKELDRSQATIGKIAEEFKDKAFAAFNSDMSSVPENTSIEPTDYMETDVYERVLSRLGQAGIDKQVAKQRIAKICRDAEKAELSSITEEDLFNAAVRTINGSELFTKKSNSGREGVTIMNKAVSEKGDAVNSSSTLLNKNVDGRRIFST